jgi:hypothetical protein
MRRLLIVAAGAAAAFAFSAAPAGATNECRGLMICVPIVGPWVVVPTGSAVPRPSVDFQLSCPRGFIVGGLDAELSAPGIDVQFRATLGSPVNPGISTSQAAVFTGALVAGSARAPTFRPHIGCIPTTGGGARVPTAIRVYPVGRPATLRVSEVFLRPGAAHAVQRCKAGETLVGTTHAVGFFTAAPPSLLVARSVTAVRSVRDGAVHVDVRTTKELRGARAIVQVGALCAGGS